MKFFSQNQEQAWNAALKLLTPTRAQLEHGLELHRNLFVEIMLLWVVLVSQVH